MKLKKIFNKKYLLKEMIKPHLPKEVWGRKKAGFNVPVAKWLRADLLSTLKEEVLEGEMLKEGLFSREYLEKTISSHSSGEQDFSHQLWGMLTLSIWYRLFLGSSSRG